MNILIKFSDSWENSFLSNDLGINSKERRHYIGSGSSGFDNYRDIKLSKNTVMGILYRIIGDQRKLSSIQEDSSAYFKAIEDSISYKEVLSSLTEDIVYLRNMESPDDKNGFSGPKPIEKTDLFSDKYFNLLWDIISYSPFELENFLINNVYLKKNISINKDRMEIGYILANFIEKNKSHDGQFNYKKLIDFGVNDNAVLDYLEKNEYISKEDKAKGLSFKIMVYCSIYKMIKNILKENPDFSSNLTKTGNISGLAKRSFTAKDFISVGGEKKKVIGNPSKWEGFLTLSDGKKKKCTYFLKRKDGTLEISLNISNEQKSELMELIDNAGVGPFVVGKKGLAYIEAIW